MPHWKSPGVKHHKLKEYIWLLWDTGYMRNKCFAWFCFICSELFIKNLNLNSFATKQD